MERRDLFTLKPTIRRRKSLSKDATGNLYPTLLRSAMKAFEPHGKVNFAGAKQAVEDEWDYRSYVLTTTIAEAIRKGIFEWADQDAALLESSYTRYSGDLHILDTIKQNQTADLGGGYIAYLPAYKPTSTGRLSAKAGTQNLTRTGKAAAYAGAGVHNYDIRSSQPTILLHFLQDAEIKSDWLRDYLASSKDDYATRAGLSVDTWKACLCAVIMGATLVQTRSLKRSKGELKKLLIEDVGVDKLEAAYSQFRRVIVQLCEESLRPWHQYLLNEWVPRNAYPGDGGRRYVKNPTGARFQVGCHLPHIEQRKLAAFLLQGQEAFFIHTLTTLSPQYDFEPVSNEHDGLVTRGEIPFEAVEHARRLTNMPYVDLVKKPFVAE